MARWIALTLTVAALFLGAWAGVLWWEAQPPDMGRITLSSVTPPATEWDATFVETWCDKAVPGYQVSGTSSLGEPELWEWFDDRFGEVHEEPTARLNGQAGLRNPSRVYDDIQVWVRAPRIRIVTYETVSHDCLVRKADQWDLRNAYSYEGICATTNLVFWGVGYGKADPSEPPSDWSIIEFDDGRRLAHGLSDVDVVYAKDSPSEPWHRYVRGTDCGVD
jgi:hypothetical protein